jgi:hypothetical protein
MATCLVARAHAIEQEGINVIVESFVVEEELAQQAEVSAPCPLPTAVDFKEGDVIVTIDLISRRVNEGAFRSMPFECPLIVKVTQAKFINVNDVCVLI